MTASDTATRADDLMRELYPLCRSITGDGVRQTLDVLRRIVPLEVTEVPSGTPVLDWTVPPEWRITSAWIEDPSGRRIVDFADHNLHVVGYSTPIRAALPLEELRPHLHSLPQHPDWIPYRTAYYQADWGFCLPDRLLRDLQDGRYEVCIDSELVDGSLTYGEAFIPGSSPDEVLLTTHTCHPSMANDNLSGLVMLALLGERLARTPHRLSYRLLFIPGTIGSITWLAANEHRLDRIKHGLVITGVGDAGGLTYKRSRHETAEVDRAAAHVLAQRGRGEATMAFYPYGYDERQFGSPGFNLPVGRISRSIHGEYPEYHTSADDLDFVDGAQVGDAIEAAATMLRVLEGNARYRNLSPKGEPQLGRRGLYRSVGGEVDRRSVEMGLLWVLNLSDGGPTLLDIAERAGLPFDAVRRAADVLEEAGLLAPVPDDRDVTPRSAASGSGG